MRRGDVVIGAERGSFAGKPRPWLVVQNDAFLDDPSSVTVCVIATSGPVAPFRVGVAPTPANGLTDHSLVLADKIVTMRAGSIDRIAGSIDDVTLAQVDQAMRYWLDL